MATPTTSSVYINVIEDVINKVREEFINNGGSGEEVLNELQGIWELKMMQAGAILDPDRSTTQKPGGASGPVHDLNVPYEGEYETPTADMLFPPTPMQTPMPGMAQTPLPGSVQTPLLGTAHTPLQGTVDNSLYNISTGGTPITPNDYTSVNNTRGAPVVKPVHGRPSPYMQPPSILLSQRPPLDVNIAYVESREDGERGAPHQHMTQDFFTMASGKRKRDEFASQHPNGGFIPQRDGAGDSTHEFKAEILLGGSSSSRILQLDGPIPDPYDNAFSMPNTYNHQGVVNDDYNIANTPAPNDIQAATPAPVPIDDDDDEPLNEDDDDDLDDVDEGEDLNTTHLVLAQFDKVTRAKNRWKCTLKDGIMHINDKDILFNKANGEFEF